MPTNVGRFVWSEYTSPDLAKAQDFYGRVCGWTFVDGTMESGPSYKVAKAAETSVAGLWSGIDGPDTPNLWLNYIEVSDAERACELATRMRGAVLKPPIDIPGVGRSAVLRDPGNGVFAVLKCDPPMPVSKELTRRGEFCWYQLRTPDPKAVAGFYAELFGWGLSDQQGPAGPYVLCRQGEKEVAGIMQAPKDDPGTSEWLCYVLVDDVDDATSIAGQAGGSVLLPPTDLPGMGRVSTLKDPFGGRIALFKWTGLPQS